MLEKMTTIASAHGGPATPENLDRVPTTEQGRAGLDRLRLRAWQASLTAPAPNQLPSLTSPGLSPTWWKENEYLLQHG